MKRLLVVVVCLILFCTSAIAEYTIKEEWGYENDGVVKKPLLGTELEYTDEQWAEVEQQVFDVVEQHGAGTIESFVGVIQVLANMDARIPYAARLRQQQYGGEYSTWYHVGVNYNWGEKYYVSTSVWIEPDGLYCSALLGWALVNSGFLNANPEMIIETNAEYCGDNIMKTKDAFEQGLISPGDTVHTSRIATKGDPRKYQHIGIVIEVYDDYILVAEMRPLQGLVVTKLDSSSKFDRLDIIVLHPTFDYYISKY